ncbi:MAG: hypothetical protein ACE5Q3_12005, partial [Alphaproteobacteria bacterium]
EAWPDIPPLEDYYDAARAAFPGALIGGGMLSYFTELNRKRPPVGHVDYVTHTTCATIHDADDRSVMETLEALPYVIESTKAFIDGRPYWVGPSAIGMRDNPYGAAPVDNPTNARLAMAKNDPRQRGLFGAAWSLGYAAHMARGGISALTLSAAAGEFGVIAHRTPYPQPYFDDLDRPAVYPVYHVIAGLAAAARRPRLEARSTAPSKIDCLAWDADGVPVLWVANLTAEDQEFSLAGLSPGDYTARVLDERAFAEAAVNARFMREGLSPVDTRGPITIGSYATVVIKRVA